MVSCSLYSISVVANTLYGDGKDVMFLLLKWGWVFMVSQHIVLCH